MELKGAIDSRRSIRKFTDAPVHPDDIIEIIDAARHAPSSGNIQPWKFILIKKQEMKNKLADACFQQNWISQASVIIVVVSKVDEVKRFYGVRGEVLYSIQNCALAMENMLLRATDLGLGATLVSAFEEGMVKRLLKIPDHIRPQGIIPVGHPDEVPVKKLLNSIESMTCFHEYNERNEDYDEAFYEWAGIMKKNATELLAKMKRGTSTLRDRINEKINKKKG